MPSDEMVEAVLDDALNAWFGVKADWDRKREDIERSDLMERMRRTLRAALAAAEAGEPVGYVAPEAFERFKREPRGFTPMFHMDASDAPEGMIPVYASPPSEASRGERAAIRKEAFEEAARIAEDFTGWQDDSSYSAGARHYGGDIATAIRARGET